MDAKLNSPSRDDLQAAAGRLYSAEVALHAARQTGIDEWVKAAADRLHEAVVRYENLLAGRAA